MKARSTGEAIYQLIASAGIDQGSKYSRLDEQKTLSLYGGIVPGWAALREVTSDYHIGIGYHILTDRAMRALQELGNIRFRRIPIVIFERPYKGQRPIESPHILDPRTAYRIPSRAGYWGVIFPHSRELSCHDHSPPEHVREHLPSDRRAPPYALVEPPGGFPPFFVVKHGSEFLVTEEGRQRILEAKLKIRIVPASVVLSVRSRS